jgi:hypothetical protein
VYPDSVPDTTRSWPLILLPRPPPAYLSSFVLFLDRIGSFKVFFFFFFFFGVVGLNPPLGPFAGPLGSYKPQYCGHILAYCTFSPDDI